MMREQSGVERRGDTSLQIVGLVGGDRDRAGREEKTERQRGSRQCSVLSLRCSWRQAGPGRADKSHVMWSQRYPAATTSSQSGRGKVILIATITSLPPSLPPSITTYSSFHFLMYNLT